MSGTEALAVQRTQPYDNARTVPPAEYVLMERRFLGIEPCLTARCPCYGAEDITTRHPRICHRAGVQVDQHKPLLHAVTRLLKQLGIKSTVEDGDSFTADRDYRMDVVVPAGELRDAPINAYRVKGLLIDVTHADPQSAGYLERGSATIDGSAAATSEACKSAHYARRGHMSFDERCLELTPLAVESFERLGKCRKELLEQVASSVVGE